MLEGARRAAGDERLTKILADIQTYHAPASDLPALVEEAGVRKLVLYHLVPAISNPMVTAQFRQGMPDGTIVADDGLLIELPVDGDAIETRQLFER